MDGSVTSSFFNTTDYDLAAALLSVAVQYAEDQQGISLVYSPSNPVSSGGSKGVHLKQQSDTGMETKVLAEAYADREADHELDRWIQELPLSDAQKEEGLALAQVSAMAYIRAAFANRETLDADTRKADPMVEISRGGKFAIVPKDGRSDSTNRKLLMKFG